MVESEGWQSRKETPYYQYMASVCINLWELKGGRPAVSVHLRVCKSSASSSVCIISLQPVTSFHPPPYIKEEQEVPNGVAFGQTKLFKIKS
jgi:hypothetical protein